MKVLFVTRNLPHAHVTGAQIVVHERIKGLHALGHEVGLVSFVREGEEGYAEDVRPYLARLETRPPPEAYARRMLHHRLCPTVPRSIASCYEPGMYRCVGDVVDQERYDVVVAETAGMGQYLNRNPYLPAVRRVISVHQGLSAVFRKALEVHRGPLRLLRDRWELSRLRSYELSMYRHVDRIVVLSPREQYELLSYAPDLRIDSVPCGVDTRYFTPPRNAGATPHLVFTGYYSDEPNSDAVVWFCKKVWPAVRRKHPHVRFLVVGPHATPAMKTLARKDPGVQLVGRVDDIRPHLAGALAFVCPLRLGSGMHGKVLEAMAMGLPVVSTSVGMEGIPAYPGENCFLADDPRLMAQSLDLLIDDPDLRSRLAMHARTLVEQRFSWERQNRQLARILSSVVETG